MIHPKTKQTSETKQTNAKNKEQPQKEKAKQRNYRQGLKESRPLPLRL